MKNQSYQIVFQNGLYNSGLIVTGVSLFVILSILYTKNLLRKITCSREQIENFISNPTAEKALDIRDFIHI
jgi:hypothetical protein